MDIYTAHSECLFQLGFVILVCGTWSPARLWSALCAVNKPTRQQFTVLGYKCMPPPKKQGETCLHFSN